MAGLESGVGQLRRDMFRELRVLIVGGVLCGVVVAGIGSRLAMMLLRFTSRDFVVGLTSDDGFTIGKFTIGGTYNLLMLGASVGLLGAGVYRLVSGRLIGPVWFRRFTVGAACAAVVGPMLVHADGIDFRVLGPTWLAIGLFVALPGVFGLSIGAVVDRVSRPESIVDRKPWATVLPVVLLVAFPATLFVLLVVTPFVVLGILLREFDSLERFRAKRSFGIVVQAAWLSVAVLGLVTLIRDVLDVSRVV